MNTVHSFRFLFILFLSLNLFSQSQEKSLTNLSYDQLKNTFFENQGDKKKQFECAQILLNKAKAERLSIQIARGFYLFSLLYDGNKSIDCLDSVINYSRSNRNVKYNFPAQAFSDKAYALKKQFRFEEAIDNFILAEKYALKSNLDFYFRVKFSIAILKSEELGEIDEALALYKNCFAYYKNKDIRSAQYSFAYQDVLFALADAYKALEQTDLASYYNRLGWKESKITKDYEYNYLFILNEGANLIVKKKYKPALDSINKALPQLIAYKNVGNVLASYYYLGKAHEGLNKKEIAVRNFIKVDSIYQKTKDIGPEFISGYPFLISYYKGIGNKEKQLEYITKYMQIDNTLQKNYKELTKKLQKEYDIPHMISEKETLIRTLKNDKNRSKWLIVFLILLAIVITLFGLYQRKLKKIYKTRFEKVINQSKSVDENTINPDKIEFENLINKSGDIGISEELIAQILDKLKSFEKKKNYLQSNVTIQILSKEFNTNANYLSKIVNEYKSKTFVQYINDLRIEYAVMVLQENRTLRKYTIQALAAEFGFNNAESFSTAFSRKTGIKPTYFIKQLGNVN